AWQFLPIMLRPRAWRLSAYMRYLLLACFLLANMVSAQELFSPSASSGFDTSILAPKDEFLSVEKAFKLSPRLEEHRLILTWAVAPNYYLYEERFKLSSDDGRTFTPRFGPGVTKYDEFFEK